MNTCKTAQPSNVNSTDDSGVGRTSVRRYTFKLYPSKAQERALEEQAVLLAQLWNAALEQRETQWRHECQRNGKGSRSGISKFDQSKHLKFVRQDDPRYAAMSADTLALCIFALDDAFKAFYKRARAGAGKSSGYPRYKASKRPDMDWRSFHHDTIWHREHRKGWRLDHTSGRNWRVYAKGVPGLIRARGKFPVGIDDLEIRDMRLMRRDNAWHCSIVVKLEPRIVAGDVPIEVNMNLIDSFAVVKNRENGQCLPGFDGGFPPSDEQIGHVSEDFSYRADVESAESGADDRSGFIVRCRINDAESAESGSDDRLHKPCESACSDVGSAECLIKNSDDVQSISDRKYKRGSWRWRQSQKTIARIKSREARKRSHDLHAMTTNLVRQSTDVLVICPPVRESTKSAKGDARAHGAAVQPVAMLNRHILSQAPATAIQMLEYKCAEAGIPFRRIEPEDHAVAIGRELPVAVKQTRNLRRQLKRMKV